MNFLREWNKHKVQKAIKTVEDFDDAFTEHNTPKFRRPTNPPSQGYKPTVVTTTRPPNVGSGVQYEKESCKHLLPCGYCDKKGSPCSVFYNESKVNKDILLGKGLSPIGVTTYFCSECAHDGCGMPQCRECNATNNFKYFERMEIVE